MKPMHLVEATLVVDDAGNGKLSVPIKPTRVARWLIRDAKDRIKTFEFDSVGIFVWQENRRKDECRATHPPRIAKEYNLELRQAEASTTAFLKTLMQKGLIGIPLDATKNGKRDA